MAMTSIVNYQPQHNNNVNYDATTVNDESHNIINNTSSVLNGVGHYTQNTAITTNATSGHIVIANTLNQQKISDNNFVINNNAQQQGISNRAILHHPVLYNQYATGAVTQPIIYMNGSAESTQMVYNGCGNSQDNQIHSANTQSVVTPAALSSHGYRPYIDPQKLMYGSYVDPAVICVLMKIVN